MLSSASNSDQFSTRQEFFLSTFLALTGFEWSIWAVNEKKLFNCNESSACEKQSANSTGIVTLRYSLMQGAEWRSSSKVCCFIGYRVISTFSLDQWIFKYFLETGRVSVEVTHLSKGKGLYLSLLTFCPTWAFRKQQFLLSLHRHGFDFQLQ